ncbi:MAG TPA: glycogen synthase GlgA [Bryobacteraceae bacterium]|nr:glycogen synthase GlgA [Bryobacteraceae bacterium]
MTQVLMVASEAIPFAKTGGLADVVGSLSPTLLAQGEQVAVLMPRYRGISVQGLPRVYEDLRVWFGPDCYVSHLYRAEHRGVPYFLLDNPALFERDGLYQDPNGVDYPDNYLRFAVLSGAALIVVRHLFRPQVIHCHDWQAALVPVYMRTRFGLDPTFMGIKTLLTIHNLGYQGLFPPSILPKIGLDPGLFRPEALEFYGQVNLLKGGLIYSDAINTVSRKYAEEIQTPELGFGLDGVLRERSDVLSGILNGVDYSEWDPRVDRYIAARYSAEDLEGKRACKADLINELGLSTGLETPLIGIISRFAGQKGFDLIEEIAPRLLEHDVAVAALGSGDPSYERMFTGLAAAYPGRVAVRIAFDEALAHKIEAGADIFLMPSRYEPCGLNQIYSLRYGTVPVVRATGGLDDTIDTDTGFKFNGYTGEALLEAVRAALAAYQNREQWRRMMLAGMRKDYSWSASAIEYAAVYRRLVE